MMVESVDTADF